ncbi:MAG: hypothetical protein FWD53_10120 [Phycisphaerales bacterium]|nr:hypothetical protein [Phycisphaerales bacterium]
MATDLLDPSTTQVATPPLPPDPHPPKPGLSQTFWWLMLASLVILVAGYFVNETVWGIIVAVVLWFLSIPLALDWQKEVRAWQQKNVGWAERVEENDRRHAKQRAKLGWEGGGTKLLSAGNPGGGFCRLGQGIWLA